MVGNEKIEQAADLDRRAVEAKESETETERLIEDFKPFLNSCASRYSIKNSYGRHDEMFSTAMLAFYESIQNYDAERGHFFQYVERVVCCRLIDDVRKIYKDAGSTIPLDPIVDEDSETAQNHTKAIDELSMRSYDDQRRRELLEYEIEQFKAELDDWGITMETLSRHSPKHKRVREAYGEIISHISRNHNIIQTIRIKRYFPVKEVAEISGYPHKNVERARTYVLATLIIKLGDYDLLSGYIGDSSRG